MHSLTFRETFVLACAGPWRVLRKRGSRLDVYLRGGELSHATARFVDQQDQARDQTRPEIHEAAGVQQLANIICNATRIRCTRGGAVNRSTTSTDICTCCSHLALAISIRREAGVSWAAQASLLLTPTRAAGGPAIKCGETGRQHMGFC